MVTITKGQPIVFDDGTAIVPGTGERGNANVVARNTGPVNESVNESEDISDDPFDNDMVLRRTLGDLPADPSRTNPMMLILAYNMWGLDATAISMLLNLNQDQVEVVMADQLYVNLRREMLEAVRYAEMGTVHGYFSRQSLSAARTVVAHMKGKDGDRALTAAKDVLDRSGFRPSDRVEHVHKFEDELRIVYVKEQPMPDVDINFGKMIDGNGA